MSASIYERKSHLKYKIFIKNVMWKEAGRDVLLTISHVTIKNGIQKFTSDLVQDLFIGQHLIPFFPKNCATVRRNIL